MPVDITAASCRELVELHYRSVLKSTLKLTSASAENGKLRVKYPEHWTKTLTPAQLVRFKKELEDRGYKITYSIRGKWISWSS